MKPYALAIFLFATAGVAQNIAPPKMERWCAVDKNDVALAKAITTRVLTKSELLQVLDQGYLLFALPCQSYSERELREEYLNALKVQVQIRKLRASSVATKEK